jgi:hypothetical protein
LIFRQALSLISINRVPSFRASPTAPLLMNATCTWWIETLPEGHGGGAA